ncbi:RE2 [Symbiodinium sp. CCMP2592]|nr:RE2 [Symbiodinium sp. CCMP2592]
MQSDAPQAGQAGHPPASPSEHHAPQSQTSSCEPHAPQSQSSTPQGDFHVNALTVTLHGPWLSLKAPFAQIDTGLVANKCTSLCYVDCTLAFPSLPIAFRTTLHNSPRGWMLHTLNEDLSTLDDFEARFEAAFPRPKMYETITIGSTYRLDVRQLFPEHSDHPLVAVPVPEESDGDPSPDAAMDLDVNIDAGGVDLGANGGDADEGESPGAAGNAPGEKPVVVDGTELTLDCTLATLRAAAQSLGIGKSGGKATVLKKIKEFLARNDFLWANLPADVQLPREQAPVREPSQDEVRKHSLTHMPFQAWCAECVQHRARSDRHERHPVGDREHATICFDFAYTSRPETPEQKLVCLVASCNFTGANQAWPVPAKGGNLQLRYMTSELTEVTLRSDPEPVCLSLQKLVQAQRLRLGLRTHLEQSEPDDHAANAAEPAVETLRQLTNTLLSEFESRAGVKVASLDAMHAWAWRHASFIQQRFTRSQGQTPFELACGRPYQGKLVCIGETVYGRVKSAVKGQPRWGIGLWLGKLGCSDGHIVFTASGHFLACRSIRRLPQTYLRSADFAKRLRDHPYSQAAFLAGQVGQCRPQKTRDAQQAPPEPRPDESVPAGADPLPYPGYVLPDNAPLSELVPPPAIRSDFVPEPPTPMQEDSGPVTPLQPAPSDAEVVSSPLAVVPDAEVLAEAPNADHATGSSDPASSSEPAAVRVPTRAAEPSANEPRKRLRLDAVTFEGVDMYHNHEENDFEFEGEILEDFDYAAEADGAHDDTRPESSIPECLLVPWSEHEPELSAEQLAHVDAVAMQFEVDRLLGIPALERCAQILPEHKHLTTRFVVTWRCKTIAGCTYWLRRARLVARDFAFLCPGRTDLFSPASNALQSKIIPCVFIDNYHNGWQLVSLDVTDAYLNCPQAEDTCTSVMINGERLYFKLLRLLPGQREGSQTWFYQFTDALKVGSRVELMQEVPSLFRFQPEDGGGGGLVHVDDLLGTGPASVIKCMTDDLERDYKVTVNLISVPGQEVHFLKKRHYLLSSTELLIEVSPKHLEKLKSLCGHPKHRKSPLPSGRLPTEKEDDAPLSQDQAFRFRSAVGVLLYLQSDLPHAMHSIRHLSGFMSSPTVGAWAILRHLVGYLSATEGYCACLTAGGIGHGVQVHRPGINPTTPPLLMIDNSAARAILQRAGVGRVRHLDVKLLWTQQRVAEGLLEVLPAPTRTNVADIGTKLLGVQRTEFLLGLIGFRDSRNGYARVGDAILSTERNVQAIRNVCKDLSKIAKGDATANTARILSVILIAMQATGSLGAEDGDDAKDDDATLTILDAILESLVQIVGYASAVYEAYPSTCVAVCQCVAITAFLMCAFMCCGRRMTDVPEASVQVRIASGVAVDVRTSRSEPKAKAGEQVRGARPKTASRPKIEDDDERAQSPGAHEVHAGRPGSSSDVLRSNSEASGRSEKIPRARPIPQRRVPQARSADGVWISTSQGYAYHKATCGKLNQSLGVTEVSRAVAEERGYSACRICKP